jgi:putative MATE family efflux protein
VTRAAVLTEGPIARTLVGFSVPILLGNVLQSLNGSINSVWVVHGLGEAALAATSNANIVMFLLLGAIFGVAMAASILVGQELGAERPYDAKRVVGTSATFFALISVAVGFAGALGSEALQDAMQLPPQVRPLATSYMRIMFVTVPFLYLYQVIMALLRGAGDAKTPFKFLVLSVGLDIVLNPILMFGLGPAPRLGIAGSATATLIANVVSLVALVVYLYRRHHPLCLRGADLKLLRLDRAIVSTLILKGVPIGLQMIVLSTSAVAMITLVNRFGQDAGAAYGAALQLWNYVQMPALAIGAAITAMAAQNFGAQRVDRVRRTARAGLAFSVTVTTSVVVLLLVFERTLLGLFLPRSSAAFALAVHANRIACSAFIGYGVSMALFAVVRAAGAVVPPVVALFFSLWLVRFPFAIALEGRWGADAVWWSFPLSGVIAALLAVLYYRYGGWRGSRMLLAPAAGAD